MATSNRRDDFSKSTKDLVARRAGFMCSRPVCQRATSGPTLQSTGAMNLGVAAHITAAAARGPRFDSSLAPADRRDISNAIWLCQNCAKMIDSDTRKFSVEVLLDWKETAEHLAMQRTQGLQAESLGVVTFDFDAADWRTHIENGACADGPIVVASFYGAGDLVYNCKISFRNRTNEQQILSNCTIELRDGSRVLSSCPARRTNSSPVELEPRQWQVIRAQNAIEPKTALKSAETVWFTASLLGSDAVHEWKVAKLSPQ